MKTVLKILAIVILTGAIVGVSVMKSSLSAKKQMLELDKIKEGYYSTQDSVYLQQLDDSTRFYIDSILSIENYYGFQIDSLNGYYDSLLKAQKKPESVKTEKKHAIIVKKASPKDPTVEAIKYNYKKRIDNLPRDLTSYERKVSVKEIVIMLSREFKVSPDSVNRILN